MHPPRPRAPTPAPSPEQRPFGTRTSCQGATLRHDKGGAWSECALRAWSFGGVRTDASVKLDAVAQYVATPRVVTGGGRRAVQAMARPFVRGRGLVFLVVACFACRRRANIL